jgi:hypothetical protein
MKKRRREEKRKRRKKNIGERKEKIQFLKIIQKERKKKNQMDQMKTIEKNYTKQ